MTQRKVSGGTYNLTYNAENKLVGVSGAAAASFVYDGDGRLVEGTVQGVTWLYVNRYYEKEIAPGTLVKKYYFAGGQRLAERKGGVLYFLLRDQLGSTAVTVGGNGNEYGKLLYEPYGGQRYASGTQTTPYRYTGQR